MKKMTRSEILKKFKRIEDIKDVYIICADPANSSCIVNADCLDPDYADRWVEKQNKEAGFKQYWVERGQFVI